MLAPETRLGPYTIVGLLGAGGMGEVYRAHDSRLEREVAIKVLPPEPAGDEKALERFRRETRAVAALSHPNIVAIFDIGSEKRFPFEQLRYGVMDAVLVCRAKEYAGAQMPGGCRRDARSPFPSS